MLVEAHMGWDSDVSDVIYYTVGYISSCALSKRVIRPTKGIKGWN